MLQPFEKPILVTRPFMPDVSEFQGGVEEIWSNWWLTNDGPILHRFADKLREFWQNKNVCLFNNGTLALQIGLQGMGLTGEVITTPFTFVATTHALFWDNIRPVFVDIEPDFYTIDPSKIEAAITPWTTAILAVHIYGHPCMHDELQMIADKYGLKLIYDSAHAFGVKVNGKSICSLGDMNMYSFHATKLFHSIEGGALVFKDSGLKKKFEYLRNFGFENEEEVVMPGTNAKMNEFQAVMGEINLRYIDKIIAKRKSLVKHYRERIQEIDGIVLTPELPDYVDYNYGYMPIEVDEELFGMSRDNLYDCLKKYNIYSRKYFYPLICDYSCYRNIAINDSLNIARKVSNRILVLPLYYNLSLDEIDRICDIVIHIKHNRNKILGLDVGQWLNDDVDQYV